MTAELPPDTAERLAEEIARVRDQFPRLPDDADSYAVAEALLPTVAQLVAERTEALELSLASDRRRLLDELHMLGVLQDQQAKLADARAEGAAEALADLAEVLMAESGAAEERISASVMEALVHRNAGAACAYEVAADMADSRAAAIRQGGRA